MASLKFNTASTTKQWVCLSYSFIGKPPTMKQLLLVIALLPLTVIAQNVGPRTNPQDVTIVRDSFGVPHIYGKTDADAAYGLAWAHCEDDFKDIQENMLPAKSMLGSALGKEGVLFDFGMVFFGIDTFVDYHYYTDLSPDYRKVVEAYVQGINDYAAKHPDEVLLKKSLPFTPQDVVKGYTLNLTLFAGAGMALKAIKENRVDFFFSPNEIGSNSMAISGSRTEDGKVWLLVNSHQPIEGRFAWYEAHMVSDEGWNMIGGLFAGGTTIFLGCNPNLGWAHTTNYHTFGDIYKLTHKGGKYLYDGQWRNFTYRTAHLKIKLGGIKLAISKKVPHCEYGPVFKTKHGWYAVRFPGYSDIRAGEQWYRMNKAKNWGEFESAIKMQAIPLFNIMYGDKDGNIFCQSGCQVALRDSTLNWRLPIDGTSSKYKWTQLVPYNRKPALFNPSCGYLFSCNQTPYNTSGPGCNWHGGFVGIQQFTYNRGERFGELLGAEKGKFTWDEFKRIKFDKSYSLTGTYAQHFKGVFNLDESKYPDIADAIRKLKHWNFQGTADNRDAALVMVMQENLMHKINGPFAMLMIQKDPVSETDGVWAIREAKKFLLKTHGTIDLPLGDVQRLIRGNVSLPASGLREVPRACDTKLIDPKKGIYRATGGDGYMQLAKFGKDGVDLFTVNAYGASSHPESKHYTDQMQMFENEQFKSMTFDKDKIWKSATMIYHPGDKDDKMPQVK